MLNGGRLVGISSAKGTTGYGALVGGSPKVVSVPGDVSGLERLLALAMAA
jgi:hypothetical protein